MKKVATAKEMQQIDRVTIEKFGVAGIVLMERAALSVVKRIDELYLKDRDRKIIVLCGGGNNGGDGLVIARILHNRGRDVKVFLAVKPGDLKGDAAVNYSAARKFGVQIYPLKSLFDGYSSLIDHHCLVIDALLGTGLNKDVREPLAGLIRKVNALSAPVLAVDIPSGVSSDSGRIMGDAIKAESTVTFGLPKRGHLLYPGAVCSGKLFVEDIGFPVKLMESGKIRVNLVEIDDARRLLPSRPRNAHKGTFGHLLIVGGSKGKTGAALMSARAALRSGAGLVTIGIPETLVGAFQSRVTEEMILPLPDKGDGSLSVRAKDAILDFTKKRADVLAIGPGLSTDGEISKLIEKIVTSSRIPLVIDADGINAIAGRTETLQKSKAPVILTPHPGEMSRLLGQRKVVKDIEKDRIGTAVSFARRIGICLVLKGAPTVTAAADGNLFINPTGNSGMASAGTGDLLTGIIASFLAQGLAADNASILGVYIHGLLGDLAAEKKGGRAMVASDMLKEMPRVFKLIQK